MDRRTLDVADGVDLVELCYERGWTDGLPVVPPTTEKVAAAVAATGRHPGDVVYRYPERGREILVEHVATNAVLAGCLPEYTPVVLALIEAMAADQFRMHVANASTSGVAVAFVVNGPIRAALGMNCRGNVLGPGNRANSTIGRAVRLIQINALGSVAGAGNEALAEEDRPILDRSTMGQPGKYACYHIAENEEDFATLRPLHVERGFSADQNVVTLVPVWGHVQWSLHGESTGLELLDTLAHHYVHAGLLTRDRPAMLLIPPEHAEIFVRDGWTKSAIAEALFERTKRSVAWLKANGWSVGGLSSRRDDAVEPADEEVELALASAPSDVLLVVAGGPAGGFAHALVSQVGGVASCEIHLPEEEA
jgi:hypothetical protein